MKEEIDQNAKSIEVEKLEEDTEDVVENLEKLLETGFAELIKTEHLEETVTEEKLTYNSNSTLK